MRIPEPAARWQTTIIQTAMRVRARAHQTRLPILPLPGYRLLKTSHPVHLPHAVAANRVTEEGLEIRGVAAVVETGERVEGVVTAVVGARSRSWAVVNGGM